MSDTFNIGSLELWYIQDRIFHHTGFNVTDEAAREVHQTAQRYAYEYGDPDAYITLERAIMDNHGYCEGNQAPADMDASK